MKKKLLWSIMLTIMVLSIAITYMVYALPGDSEDPVISLSYLKDVFMPQIKTETTFQIVNVEKGQKLICEQGTELIQRMGQSVIVATQKGGIADTTMGTDLQNGTATPSNHLLIVPVSDGRGIEATENCIFMIKGKFELK